MKTTEMMGMLQCEQKERRMKEDKETHDHVELETNTNTTMK